MSCHGRLNHGGTMAADYAESGSGQSTLLPSERETVRRFLAEFDIQVESGAVCIDRPDDSFWPALSALRSLAEPQEGGGE